MLRRSFVLTAVAAMVVWGAQSFAYNAQAKTQEGKVVKAEEGKLTIKDKDGKEKAHAVATDAKVTCDGKECKLEDLKAGYPVKITIEKKGDEELATKVEATKA